MLFEDGFFCSDCKESQRRSRAVGRRNVEDCCSSLVRELQRSLLPGGCKGKHEHNKEGVMQMQILRRAVLGFMALGLTLSVLAILSCGGGSDDNVVKRQANLSGTTEVPAVPTSPGTGTAVLTISDNRQQIDYVLTYTGLTNVLQAHIHAGSPTKRG